MPNFKARPTIYKGFQMRSRLEAGFAGWLDRMHLKWEYEPYAVGDEHGQYLPDFLVQNVFEMDGETAPAHIEIKPSLDVVDWDRMGRAAQQLMSSTHAVLFLVTPAAAPLILWPGGGHAAATWTHADGPCEHDYSAHLQVAAFEPPFQRDWWT